ncbi:MAG: DUF192 domain-containing protein [Actinomycetota bacterium]
MRTTELVDPRGRTWRVEVPGTRRERMHGLRDRGFLPPDHAMLFPRCRSVHTFGMRFPITVAFVDARWRVVAVRRLPPGRLAWPRLGARSVVECPAGADLRPGDVFQPADRSPATSAGP